MRTTLLLSACLAGLAAADTPAAGGGVLGGLGEQAAGRPLRPNQRQVVVQGFVDLDGIRSYNATDGDNDRSDSAGYGLLRADLGLELRTETDVTVTVAFGYHGQAGGLPADSAIAPIGNGDTGSSDTGALTLNRAQVRIDSFLGMDSLGLAAGRSGISPALAGGGRKDHALLFDSRADDRDVTGWDGARLSWAGVETLVFTAGLYRLPDASTWWFLSGDWSPATSGDDRMFLTGSVNMQQNLELPGGRIAEEVITIHGGGEWNMGVSDWYVEGAYQDGDIDDSTSLGAWAVSGGIDWLWNVPNPVSLGVGMDWLSGDKAKTTDEDEGFANPFETIGDLYLFENEKYGELLRGLQGDTQSFKARFGYGFDERGTIGVDLAYGFVRMSTDGPGGDRDLGHELDLTLRWKYQGNTRLRLFAGAVKPEDAFTALIPGAGDDPILLFGAGVTAGF